MRLIGSASLSLFLVGLLAACSVSEAPVATEEVVLTPLGTTIRVTTTSPSVSNDGQCSLIEAIQAANTDRAVDTCAAGSGADTIELKARTYYFGQRHSQIADYDYVKSALPVITEDLTIEGNGATIEGPYPYRAYDMNLITSSYTNLSLNNLNLENAYSSSGGAALDIQGGHLRGVRLNIRNNGTDSGAAALDSSSAKISLSQCIIENNESNDGVAGIRAYATRIYRYDAKTIHLDECIIRENKTATGVAAIKSTGDMSVVKLERSSVVKNEVKEYVRSGTSAFRWPAIVYNHDDAQMEIVNTSLAENVGPVYNVVYNASRLDMNFATVYYNQSPINAKAVYGVYNDIDGEASLKNTAMVRNKHVQPSVGLGHQYGNCRGRIESKGHNFDSDGSCAFSELTDVQDRWQWAMLLPLNDNGGFTPTYEPAGWSKLRNAGDDYSHYSEPTDQRGAGFPRLTSESSDIGAVETCESYTIFWLFIFPIPICADYDQVKQLSIPVHESPLEELAELNDVLEIACKACDMTIHLDKTSGIYVEFDQEQAEAFDHVALYSEKGELLAKGHYALKAELAAGTYYLDLAFLPEASQWIEAVDLSLTFFE